MKNTVLIFGGNSRLGRLIGSFLVKKNFNVISTYRTKENLSIDENITHLQLDIENNAEISGEITGAFLKENNVSAIIFAYCSREEKPLHELSFSEIDTAYNINIKSILSLYKESIYKYALENKVDIININSLGALGLDQGKPLYSINKSGQRMLFHAMATDLNNAPSNVYNLIFGTLDFQNHRMIKDIFYTIDDILQNNSLLPTVDVFLGDIPEKKIYIN